MSGKTKIVISYNLPVTYNKKYAPGTDFLPNEGTGSTDFLSARLVIDGKPFRHSGSHVSASASLGINTLELDGHIAVILTSGNHTVQLQWKKQGTYVRVWVSDVSFGGGPSAVRSVVARVASKRIWYTHPLDPIVLQQNDVWTDVVGQNLTVFLPAGRKTTLSISYCLYARPATTLGIPVMDNPDKLEARIEIDGQFYQESHDLKEFHTQTSTTAYLSGNLYVTLSAGQHDIKVKWRKRGEHVRFWRSDPDFLDGFSSSRGLIVVEEVFPVQHSYSVSPNELDSSNSQWRDLQDSFITFQIPSSANILLAYSVSFQTLGRSSFDAWRWHRWQALKFRLVINGAASWESGSIIDSLLRSSASVRGQTVIPMIAGEHSARLQWSSSEQLQFPSSVDKHMVEGFSSTKLVVALVSAPNNAPTIHFPENDRPFFEMLEDTHLVINGIYVEDLDSWITPNAVFAVTISVFHGTVTLASTSGLEFVLGDGNRDAQISFFATLDTLNVALAMLTYHSFQDWWGTDYLRISVSDQGATGSGGPQSAELVIEIRVNSVNDQVALSVPKGQKGVEDVDLVIRGVYVFDIDWVDSQQSRFHMNISCQAGTISLFSSDGITFESGNGTRDRFISITADLLSLNYALATLIYHPDPDYNRLHYVEVLSFSVSDLGIHGGLFPNLSHATIAKEYIPIDISPVNDKPIILKPTRNQIRFMGYAFDSSSFSKNETILVHVTLSSGFFIALKSLDDVHFIEGRGRHDASLKFNSTLSSASNVLSDFTIFGDASLNGGFLRISVASLQDSQKPITDILLDFSLSFNSSNSIIIDSISPSAGSLQGGYALTLSGKFDFEKSYRCIFGSVGTSDAIFVDHTLIECIAPSITNEGPIAVKVRENLSQQISNAMRFDFFATGILFDIRPPLGPISGGTPVVITGKDIPNAVNLVCIFTKYDEQAHYSVAYWLNDSAVICNSPKVDIPHLALVTLSIAGKIPILQGKAQFHYYSAPLAQQLSPEQISQLGNVLITIYGSNFVESTRVACRFGQSIVLASYISNNSIQCLAPASTTPFNIVVSNNGIDFHESNLILNYSGEYIYCI